MPFARPTLQQLITRFKEDIRAHTEGGDALLRRSVERVLAKAVPGLTHGLYGYLAWVARQLLPSTGEEPAVLAWASIMGVDLRPAAPAIGVATFATTGASIPIGAVVRRSSGARYLVTSASVGGGVVTVELEAETPGATGNADAAAVPVTLVSPVAGVSSSGVTDGDGFHDGVDVETIESLRARVVHRLRTPPRGGSRGDYIRWAMEIPGVTRVWETPRVLGAGTVGVQFVTDDPVDPFGSPIPLSTKVDQVQDYLVERAPVTIGRSIDGDWVGVVTTAPTPHVLAIEIADLEIEAGADLGAVKLAIELEVVDFLRREAEPGKTMRRSRLDEAISAAGGEVSHVLVTPAADIVMAPGALLIYDQAGNPIVWS